MFLFKYSRVLFVFLALSVTARADEVRLSSPDAAVQVRISTGRELKRLLQYSIYYKDRPGIKSADIGIETKTLNNISLRLLGVDKKTVGKTWMPVYGERNLIPENYNELSFRFAGASDPSWKLTMICRAYNEGFAFQYRIEGKGKEIVLNKELSRFQFPEDADAWASSMAQSEIKQVKINVIKGIVERPLTVKAGSNLYLALGEAGLVDFARMKFSADGNDCIIAQLQGPVKHQNLLTSPWRYILLGGSPGDLLEKNYLLLNLNEPNQIKNTKWIQPGKVLRESTLTTNGAYNCIDFAAAHDIRYICFDAGWYGREDSDTSDATRVAVDPARSKGPLDLPKVIAYSKERKIGVILYVNRRALERQIDTLLPLYKSWGIKGLKFGFVQVGTQEWTSWLHEAIRKAAKYNMLVDVHDEYRPTGYSRTYPNLLTQEGIRGDEERPKTEHSITTLFTRMIAGAADNTNCYFTDRVNEMGSHVAQMAKSVCIYSPMQFLYWYDQPVPVAQRKGREAELVEVPEMAWYDAIPTVWDDTRVLEGDMEAYATIARKSKDSWYVASLNGLNSRKATWKCDFLDKDKKYRAVVYTDDATMNTRTKVKISAMDVDYHSVLSFDIEKRNGVAIHISPR